MSIVYSQEGNLARITLDDGKVNAMNPAFFAAFNAALDRAEQERPGAVVITGRQGFFSAGLDLKLLPTLKPDELATTLVTFGRTMLRIFLFPIPTVAAVTGHAIAGGAMLAFACDLRWLTDGPFKLHLNEVAIGLPLPSWAIAIARSAVAPRYQTEAFLHARAYLPADALARGFVNGVAPADRLLVEAEAAAAPLTTLDPPSYATSKQRHRAMEVKWVSDLLETEMRGFSPRPRG